MCSTAPEWSVSSPTADINVSMQSKAVATAKLTRCVILALHPEATSAIIGEANIEWAAVEFVIRNVIYGGRLVSVRRKNEFLFVECEDFNLGPLWHRIPIAQRTRPEVAHARMTGNHALLGCIGRGCSGKSSSTDVSGRVTANASW